jgi:hypothetical protein
MKNILKNIIILINDFLKKYILTIFKIVIFDY